MKVVEVHLVGFHPRCNKIALLKVLRSLGGCTLSAAKRAIDSALAGDRGVIEVEGLKNAEELARNLVDYGAIVICNGRTYDPPCDGE